ncbi:MAG: hypothetical protein BMS9Abin28_2093 [Anaerolineae bacterium]|nr:MAG: hypothetical protein BMS9Abin28_2093 [Anaerolineae bacterium]
MIHVRDISRANKVRLAIKVGLFGTLALQYLIFVGIIETFHDRYVIKGLITIGETMILLIFAGTGYLAVWALKKALNPVQEEHEVRVRRSWAVGSGALSGLVVGASAALLVIVNSVIELRNVFVSISPTLIEIVTFGRGNTLAGLLIPMALSTTLGAIGGTLYVTRADVRRIVVYSFFWVTSAALISDLLRVSLSRPGFPKFLSRAFTASNGLTVLGAVTVVALVVAWTVFGPTVRSRWATRKENMSTASQRNVQYGQWSLVFLLLLTLPVIVGVFPSEVLNNIGLYIIMGFGLNIVVGMAGLLDLGYVAFFAVGAYSMAVLTTAQPEIGGFQLTFWAALPFVIIITGFAGLLVGAPVLRMRGDYLAIVTLGFGEIARFLALSDWLAPFIGGAQGIIHIPKVSIGPLVLRGPQLLYYLFLLAGGAALFISWRIKDSRTGRAWMAMREDERVADSMGVNTVYYKLLAFGMGAMIASLSGALFVAKLGSIYPHSFSVLVSITALSLLIVGGIGSLPGVIAGAVVLVGLPELLREFGEYRLLMYGALLVTMMILRPEGIIPSVERARELHEEDRAQDQVFKLDEPTAAPANPSGD